jgi:hypothetical protein
MTCDDLVHLAAPDTFLAELRYHLGLTVDRPPAPELDDGGPIFAPDRGSPLPGGSFASLTAQDPKLHWLGLLGLYVRTYVLDTPCTR